jgi:sigma-54 specific flagellar transcriptional regulator A
VMRFQGKGRPMMHLTEEAMAVLEHYHWPGNVRELANLVERLSILYPNKIIAKEDLPWRIRGEYRVNSKEYSDRDALLGIMPSDQGKTEQINLKEYLSKTELALIEQALDETDWVVARAALHLKMRRTTLVEKIKKYGLTRPERV